MACTFCVIQLWNLLSGRKVGRVVSSLAPAPRQPKKGPLHNLKERGMVQRVLVVMLALMFLAPAVVLASHQNDNDQDQDNGNHGGNGGNGGNWGNGGQWGQCGNSHNVNRNRNQNSNANTNVNVNQNVNRNSNRQHQGQSQGQFQLQGQKQSNKQGQSLTNQPNQTIEGDKVEVYANAPAVSAPGLTSAPETCMGSTSAGGSGSNGVFGLGLSFGSTWKSEDCELRMFSKRLQELGQTEAALALISQNPSVAAALRAAGYKAAWLRTEKDQTPVVVSQTLPGFTPADGNFAARRSD